jgi:hypothetical protein
VKKESARKSIHREREKHGVKGDTGNGGSGNAGCVKVEPQGKTANERSIITVTWHKALTTVSVEWAGIMSNRHDSRLVFISLPVPQE